MSFRLFSNDLEDGGKLPLAQALNGMGYSGANRSPHLAWDGVPDGTKSFAVTMYDPDAPTGSGWWHWIVVDLPASASELPAGAGSGAASLPAPAYQTRTDFGTAGYGGAAPPGQATHRYIFTVHALSVEKLDVTPDASGAYVGFNVHFNTLGKAELTVTFV